MVQLLGPRFVTTTGREDVRAGRFFFRRTGVFFFGCGDGPPRGTALRLDLLHWYAAT